VIHDTLTRIAEKKLQERQIINISQSAHEICMRLKKTVTNPTILLKIPLFQERPEKHIKRIRVNVKKKSDSTAGRFFDAFQTENCFMFFCVPQQSNQIDILPSIIFFLK